MLRVALSQLSRQLSSPAQQSGLCHLSGNVLAIQALPAYMQANPLGLEALLRSQWTSGSRAFSAGVILI